MTDHSRPGELRVGAARLRAHAEVMPLQKLRSDLMEAAEQLELAAKMIETSNRMIQRLQQESAEAHDLPQSDRPTID